MGTITQAIANNLTTGLGGASGINFRNLIINGDMNIAQRATSFTGLTGISYNLDRWETTTYTMTGGQYQVDQSTDAPEGFAYSQKISCTTAHTQDVNNQFYIQQQIEGVNSSQLNYFVASPDTVTLSFWVKANLTGSYTCALKLSDNGSVESNTSTRVYNTTYSISSADTWEKKTVTIVLDSAVGDVQVVDNRFAVSVQWWLGAGTSRDGAAANSWINNGNATTAADNLDLLGSTANEWYVTGVQLEAGTTASDFEFLPVDVNLQRCQRYCYRINGNATDEQQIGGYGWCSTTSNINVVYQFNPPMRTIPTVTEASLKDTITDAAVSVGSLFDDNQVGDCTVVGIGFPADSGTPFTVNQVAPVRCLASTGAFIQFSSEL